VQGWEQWAGDIQDIVAACESEQVIDTVQERNREQLKAISRERVELYQELGESITNRRQALFARIKTPTSKPTNRKPTRRSTKTSEGSMARAVLPGFVTREPKPRSLRSCPAHRA
jgi:hypothetical protein